MTLSQEFVFFGNSLSYGMLHLSPLDGQVEVAIDVLASRQEFGFFLCEAVDEARGHADDDRVSSALYNSVFAIAGTGEDVL